jgi:uncharacterized iron-regulated protein
VLLKFWWWCGVSLALLTAPNFLGFLGGDGQAMAAWASVSASGDQINQAQERANAEVLQAIAQSQVVYLAETHDDAADHAAQLEIIQALAEQGEVAIGLEMFQRPFQPVLDAYLSGAITEATLIAESEYETRWGFDWAFYAPILQYAKANQIPVIALNTPTEVTRKVASEGLESLAGEDLAYIPPIEQLALDDEDYRRSLQSVVSAHGGAGHSSAFDNFFEAQVLWDETMAEGVAAQLLAQPNRQMIVLAGEGHIVNGYGIPNRVVRRLPNVVHNSVRLVAAEEEVALEETDFVWITETSEL